MSEYEQVIDEIVKHGVVVKVNRVVDDNYITCERKYVGCVVELDFSEHDKVFEDKIELLNRNLNLQKDKRCEAEIERNYLAERFNQLKDENDELKQRIAEFENENKNLNIRIFQNEIEKEKKNQIAELESELKSKDDFETDRLVKLPFDPLETANMLINATYKRGNCMTGTIYDKDIYDIDDLEQIAEHLLVYCKHNREDEE